MYFFFLCNFVFFLFFGDMRIISFSFFCTKIKEEKSNWKLEMMQTIWKVMDGITMCYCCIHKTTTSSLFSLLILDKYSLFTLNALKSFIKTDLLLITLVCNYETQVFISIKKYKKLELILFLFKIYLLFLIYTLFYVTFSFFKRM